MPRRDRRGQRRLLGLARHGKRLPLARNRRQPRHRAHGDLPVGLKDNYIRWAIVDNEPFIVLGNNRFLAAKHLQILDELLFMQVDVPVVNTSFNTFMDILDTIGNVRLPKYRGTK